MISDWFSFTVESDHFPEDIFLFAACPITLRKSLSQRTDVTFIPGMDKEKQTLASFRE